MQHAPEIVPAYRHADCLLCGPGPSELLYARPDYRLQNDEGARLRLDLHYRLCLRCGLVYQAPRPDPASWLAFYAGCRAGCTLRSEFASDDDLFPVSPEKAELYRRACPPGSRVLEIGCGSGHLMAWLRAKCDCRPFGLEVSRPLADFAEQRFGFRVLRRPAETLQLRRESLDAVVSVHTFEHLDDPLGVLRRVAAMLKPKGRIILEVPSVYRPSDGLRDIYSAHTIMFSPATLERLALLAGLRVETLLTPDNLFAVLVKQPGPALPSNDAEGVRAFFSDFYTAYQAQKTAVDRRMRDHLARWQRQKTRLAIWGAGEHSMQLLQEYPLAELAPIGLIDASPQRWGQTLEGLPILPPQHLQEGDVEEVLVSSRAFENEIAGRLRQEFPRLRVATLYQEIAP